MYHPKQTGFRRRTIWSLRYKAYVLVLLVFLLPILAANNNNFISTVAFVGYQETKINPLYSQVNRGTNQSIAGIIKNLFDNQNLDFTTSSNINALEIQAATNNQISQNKRQPLDGIIRRPSNPQLKSFLTYGEYGINVPVVFSTLKDFFVTDSNGDFVKNEKGQYVPIEENKADIAAGNYTSVPVQVLLKDGIVHIAYTVEPGEIGNSYIVGHSSNFSTVISNYNRIFKPLEERSQVGQTFIIYDKYGRELHFKVFEVLKIDANDVNTAYKRFDDRRVVTLQTSILDKVTFEPTQRWLTRGELVIEDSK
jgi:Sortase domain